MTPDFFLVDRRISLEKTLNEPLQRSVLSRGDWLRWIIVSLSGRRDQFDTNCIEIRRISSRNLLLRLLIVRDRLSILARSGVALVFGIFARFKIDICGALNNIISLRMLASGAKGAGVVGDCAQRCSLIDDSTPINQEMGRCLACGVIPPLQQLTCWENCCVLSLMNDDSSLIRRKPLHLL
jgi:hypothetical protein